MTLKLKTLLCSVAAAVLMLPLSGEVRAQDQYPSRNITMVCGFAAGSGLDIIARYFADRMSKVIGKPIVVENKPGANSLIATEYVTKQRPDGYTIYATGTGALAPIVHLWEKPPVNGVTDIEYITTINRQTFFIVVDAKSPHKSVADLTAHMKAKNGKGSYGTTAINGVVLGALYKDLAKIDITDVAYRTMEPAVNDLLDGQLDAIMADPVGALAQIEAGRLRGLAVASGRRLDSQPSYPTMKEQGLDMDLTSYLLFAGPRGIPRPVIDRLHAVIKEVVMTEETKAFLNKFGGDQLITTPEELRAMMEREQKLWGDYIKLAKIPKMG
jgi:tripartite-type tricarboxylate transporter receptor subunit TctC